MPHDHDTHALLWDEYKYRHDHIWKKLFQVTVAVVLLGAVPYLRADIGQQLGVWILATPLLGSLLSVIALSLMHFELALFARIVAAHRRQQERHCGIRHDAPSAFFRYLVMLYVGALCLISLANVLVVWRLWLPTLS